MTKAEIAIYLGAANALLSNIDAEAETETDIILKIRQALLEAQLILTQQGVEDYMKEGGADMRGDQK